MKALYRLSLLLLIAGLMPSVAMAADTARQIIAKAALAEDEDQKKEIITSLIGHGDDAVPQLLDLWKADKLFIHTTESEEKTVVLLIGEEDDEGALPAVRVDDGTPFKDASGKQMKLIPGEQTAVEHDRGLRSIMKNVLDLLELSSPDAGKRAKAVETLGFSQNVEKLPALEARMKVEQDARVSSALRQAVALIKLKDPSDEVKIASLKELQALHNFASYDVIKGVLREAEAASKPEIVTAANSALVAIDNHRTFVDFFGTLFRGMSTGSILLIAALGLAITFGLMGVINMAHGEMIAIGAYTTYIVQNIFGAGVTIPLFGWSLAIPGMNAGPGLYNSYFLFAIPMSFLVAALVGIALERGIIQFLYRRPLESLLATWGVSLVMQQALRLTFGANNVQVGSPDWLSGNWTLNDIIFNWNRVFVIGFAIFIVFGTYLVLTKTSLGLLMRAVMQNRNMAACMGIRTSRVNMLTFGFGSGLAGLAGAFLSQITNTGPSLGQAYVVDCFMTVVVGGVGNIAGTVASAVGIGMTDQSIQQILQNPVMGKILVLVGIILFLQWRPAGIFVTRSRSLD